MYSARVRRARFVATMLAHHNALSGERRRSQLWTICALGRGKSWRRRHSRASCSLRLVSSGVARYEHAYRMRRWLARLLDVRRSSTNGASPPDEDRGHGEILELARKSARAQVRLA